MNKIKLKKAHVITDRNKIIKLAKMTNGIIGIETLKIELYKKGEDMTREPKWFKEFRIQNDKRWEENNKLWEKQLNFNNQVTQFMKTITALPAIKKELATGK